jgi:amino acid adenylation domain-containing protein
MNGAGIEGSLPLSALQEGLLYHAVCGEYRGIYVVQSVLDLEGVNDPAELRRRAQCLVDRHANLRASFRYLGAHRPLQVVHRSVRVPWRDVDLSGSESVDDVFRSMLDADRRLGFDLTIAPLIRFMLVAMGQRRFRLLLTYHQIIMDGWSATIAIRELLTGLPAIGARPPSYREYPQWLAKRDHAGARRVWSRYLADMPEPTCIAARADRVTPAEPPEVFGVSLSGEATASLTARLQASSLTLDAVPPALWGVLLGRLTGSRDVIFGSAVAGWPPKLNGSGAIGQFLNTVPVRVRWSPLDSAASLVGRVQRDRAALLEHQHLSLAEIQEVVGHRKLFDTYLALNNHPVTTNEDFGSGIRLTGLRTLAPTHYPLTVSVSAGEQLRIQVEYQRQVLCHATAIDLADRYLRLLDAFAADPGQALGSIHLLPPRDRERLVTVGVAGPGPARKLTLGDLFQRRAALSPDSVAVVAGSHEWSYAELNAAANRLAHYLIGLGIGPERTAALVLNRSCHQLTALLATVKAGGAYLPIDPELPRERIHFMLTDAGVSAVLVTSDLLDLVSHLPVPLVPVDRLKLDRYPDRDPVDADRRSPLRMSGAAYVIYTSGSTGTPRGVVVPHQGLTAVAKTEAERFGVEEGHRILQFASISFDGALEDMLIAFWAGAALVLLPEPLAGHDLAEFLHKQSIDYVELPPTVLGTLPDTALPQLSMLCASGEECPQHLAERWSAGRRMINIYGPTEATVSCMLSEPLTPAGSVTIGRPLPGTRAYILDGNLEPAPVGMAGELYIAGDCLARGYQGHPGLTASCFVADPFGSPGSRMYRSGDLAAWDSAHRLVFAGRVDGQVKLRGHRVELGEIEALLAELPEVDQAAVVVRKEQDGDARLVAYLVAVAGQTIDCPGIRIGLERRLPKYMVPSALTVLDRLPRTASGKLDRRALPPPVYLPAVTSRAPRTVLEHQLCRIFTEILRTGPVGVDDNFFELGGHSLLAIRAVSRIRAITDVGLSLASMLRAPTVAAVAHMIEQADPMEPIRRVPRPVPPSTSAT